MLVLNWVGQELPVCLDGMADEEQDDHQPDCVHDLEREAGQKSVVPVAGVYSLKGPPAEEEHRKLRQRAAEHLEEL